LSATLALCILIYACDNFYHYHIRSMGSCFTNNTHEPINWFLQTSPIFTAGGSTDRVLKPMMFYLTCFCFSVKHLFRKTKNRHLLGWRLIGIQH